MKRYSSDKTHHYLTDGKHRVAIIRKDSKRRTKSDEKELDRMMKGVVSFRVDEQGHRSNRG